MYAWLVALIASLLATCAHIVKEGRLEKEGNVQRGLHKLYAVLEPVILKLLDWMLKSRLIGGNKAGRLLLKGLAKLLWFLPHGVVVDYAALERLLVWIEKQGDSHIVIGPCVCKRALGVREEPYMTNMTILYGAEIYKEVLPEEYRFISKDEALRMLKEFEKHGLVHAVFACFNSSKWTFVICNCDRKYCVPLRAYLKVREGMYPGSLVAEVSAELRRGTEECGECMEVCPFNAVEFRDGKPYVDKDRCMGWGLCVERCPADARRLVPGERYRPRVIPLDIMYPSLAGAHQPV